MLLHGDPRHVNVKSVAQLRLKSESAAKAVSMSEIPGQSSGPYHSCNFETTVNHFGLLETSQFAVG